MVGRARWGGLRRTLLRGAVSAATIAFVGGGAVLLGAPPASAASSTDSVYVYDYPTNVQEPLPAGTPDVVTPLVSALVTACDSLGGTGYQVAQSTQGLVLLCYVGPRAVGLTVVGVGPAGPGVFLPYGAFGQPGCGVAVAFPGGSNGSTSLIGLAPPGATC